MNYPTELTEIEKEFTLYLPVESLVKKTYEQMSEMDKKTPFPFWSSIWPASIALTRFLKNNIHWIENKTVLELGAGIGQPSFSIANKAKHLIISDYNKDAVVLMKKNIDYLRLTNTQARLIDWNFMDYSLMADTILLSDINYDSFEFTALIQVIEHYINKGSTIIIATPLRMVGAAFIQSIQTYIQHTHKETIAELDKIVETHVYTLHL